MAHLPSPWTRPLENFEGTVGQPRRNAGRHLLDPPTVSVIMPMRNAERYVKAALESIVSQNYPEIEVIVVDDGSTDRSAQKVRPYLNADDRGLRVRMIQGPGQGIAAAFNCGLSAATGEFLMRCDADDRFVPGRIARQVAFLRKRPDVVAVCQAYRAIDSNGRYMTTLAAEHAEGDATQDLLDAAPRTHLCTFAMRTEVVRQLGGCRQAFVTAEDIDLQLRLAQQGSVYFLPGAAYEYRVHDESITHQQPDVHRLFYEGLARDCQRERALGGPDTVERGAIPQLPEGIGKARSAKVQLQGYLTGRAWALRRSGDLLGACYFGARAVSLRPTSLHTWKSSLALLMPGKGKPPGTGGSIFRSPRGSHA